MAELVTLTEDGPLGKAGAQVWVDDPSQAQTPEGWVDPNAKSPRGRTAAQPALVVDQPVGDSPS
jgi:hypothetical protein